MAIAAVPGATTVNTLLTVYSPAEVMALVLNGERDGYWMKLPGFTLPVDPNDNPETD